nr:hypothetical protein [Microbacterium sp. VKM Ac-2870]
MTDEKPTPDAPAFDATDEPSAGLSAEPTTAADAAEHSSSDTTADGDANVAYGSFSEACDAMTDGPDGIDESAPPQYGVGPFSVREMALAGIWLVAFVVSFFPIYSYGSSSWGTSVWTGIDWLLTIGVPTVAVFLLGLRRLSPQGIRRVGSLGIDQFASVAFSVSAIIWLGILWSSFVSASAAGVFLATWVVWVELILMLAGVVLTVFAPLLPTIGDDFRYRTEVPAHRYARPARPVVARPVVARPTAHTVPSPVPIATEANPFAPQSPQTAPAAGEKPAAETTVLGQQTTAPAASQAFWALVPVERDVVDESGAPLFRIGPTAWALVIEDRGDSFVLRHEDGRIGYLRDVSGVTRG